MNAPCSSGHQPAELRHSLTVMDVGQVSYRRCYLQSANISVSFGTRRKCHISETLQRERQQDVITNYRCRMKGREESKVLSPLNWVDGDVVSGEGERTRRGSALVRLRLRL